jgi:hypothetical protein
MMLLLLMKQMPARDCRSYYCMYSPIARNTTMREQQLTAFVMRG